MDSDVISHKLDHGIITGYPGEDPLGISIQKICHGQICGNDSCLFIHDPLVNAAEKLRGYKAVGQLCTQIVDDEQIAVIDKRSHICRLDVFLKSIFRQQIKEIKGAEIQNKKRPVQKLFGDAVGEISLSHTSISINHKIIEFFSEAVYEVPGLVISLMGGVQSGYAALGICELRGVILKRKMLKIFLFQDIPDIGLGIEKISPST